MLLGIRDGSLAWLEEKEIKTSTGAALSAAKISTVCAGLNSGLAYPNAKQISIKESSNFSRVTAKGRVLKTANAALLQSLKVDHHA